MVLNECLLGLSVWLLAEDWLGAVVIIVLYVLTVLSLYYKD